MHSAVPLLAVRTGTGVASTAPVTKFRAPRSAISPLWLALPCIAGLIELDGTLVEWDRRSNGRGLQLQVLRFAVDHFEVALTVEHRREDRLRKFRVEPRVHDKQVLHARLRDLWIVLVDAR